MASSSRANGEGSSQRTLGETMRAPSVNPPGIVVLDILPDDLDRKEVLDPSQDLWLSTSDGRYSSAIIPLRIGLPPHQEIFQVHKSVLLKAEWFRKALLGNFLEAEAQSLDLPEEDPAIFHFLVAYLYEERYVPTKPLSTALVLDPDKGKGKDVANGTPNSDSDSDGLSWHSDSSAQSRRRQERRRRRQERQLERLRQKHPGQHRPNCPCPQCANSHGPPCWACAAPRFPPVPPPMYPPGVVVQGRDRSWRNQHHRRRGPDGRPIPPRPGSPPAMPPSPSEAEARIKGEDMRTWLIAYELNIDVYICADRYMLEGFKEKILRVTIDMLESAGPDAAQVEVLRLCRKIYDGVGDNDSLLKMVFARVGFLQPTLWKNSPEETGEFLLTNPEVATLMLKETSIRREEDFSAVPLPSMERATWTMPPGRPYDHQMLPRPLPRGVRY
ncbi:hypothetical protein KVR01_005570 [Diaporthe batatas]|uniref:uncharacterized protein n=1 Tax=Diaporthe batatas TaxID=748121 RepID=UPI001D040638|nr:uncharacterized protein KVR01_005570 [Diaporthe batatas]KAG8165295.1 hypothetical protein KVR01_005570 [Diaporthe batatas]